MFQSPQSQPKMAKVNWKITRNPIRNWELSKIQTIRKLQQKESKKNLEVDKILNGNILEEVDHEIEEILKSLSFRIISYLKLWKSLYMVVL